MSAHHYYGELPPIDWSFALSLSGNRPRIAKELLDSFIKDLPNTQHKIKTLMHDRDYSTLEHIVHQFHGACSYTGVPELKRLTQNLEAKLKHRDYDRAGPLADQILALIQKTLDYYSSHSHQFI